MTEATEDKKEIKLKPGHKALGSGVRVFGLGRKVFTEQVPEDLVTRQIPLKKKDKASASSSSGNNGTGPKV